MVDFCGDSSSFSTFHQIVGRRPNSTHIECMYIVGIMGENFTFPVQIDQKRVEPVWKKNKDIVAEWEEQNKPTYFDPLRNRSVLMENGSLTIFNLEKDDAGTYTLQYWDSVKDHYLNFELDVLGDRNRGALCGAFVLTAVILVGILVYLYRKGTNKRGTGRRTDHVSNPVNGSAAFSHDVHDMNEEPKKVPNRTLGENPICNIQSKPPLTRPRAISSSPVTGHESEDIVPVSPTFGVLTQSMHNGNVLSSPKCITKLIDKNNSLLARTQQDNTVVLQPFSWIQLSYMEL
ncbi:hypothetical protein TURU_004237 [Turdus rufiventris]|nr:hypothetical protein TURU_004237 [Turdus rufiventris]